MMRIVDLIVGFELRQHRACDALGLARQEHADQHLERVRSFVERALESATIPANKPKRWLSAGSISKTCQKYLLADVD